MGGWGWVELIRIKAVLSSTGLELELELSLAKSGVIVSEGPKCIYPLIKNSKLLVKYFLKVVYEK